MMQHNIQVREKENWAATVDGWERTLTPHRLRSCEPPANSALSRRMSNTSEFQAFMLNPAGTVAILHSRSHLLDRFHPNNRSEASIEQDSNKMDDRFRKHAMIRDKRYFITFSHFFHL
ncbi:uncharacterized protein LOC105423794 isoform X1 [Pogonomyrmex barbatus]|uniref:Uncharacterized protein LOC105423794 isoform X1 n=1 Tax=Pogonomyrmex barbatus TaxID=144034 RepID=A0A6I9VST8_9HYME|nr:uncharacterized protein LOC105423794 isoform X1 [Pogonomyrmex barbatus]